MASVSITADFDVQMVAKDIKEFSFENISVQEFVNLVEYVEPQNYNMLMTNVLNYVNGVLPDDVLNLLLTGDNLNYNGILGSYKFNTEQLQNIIDNYINEIDIEYLLDNQELTFEQFVQAINNCKSFCPQSLGTVIGISRNVEYAKYIIENWNSIKHLSNRDITYFQYCLFDEFGSVLMSDADSVEIFGFARPSMSSEELRSYEPCRDGWSRTMKWAGRNDTKYTWNEFIARHVLANQDDVDNAKSDLEWLAESVREHNNYFSSNSTDTFY